jgi:hypothetical protein
MCYYVLLCFIMFFVLLQICFTISKGRLLMRHLPSMAQNCPTTSIYPETEFVSQRPGPGAWNNHPSINPFNEEGLLSQTAYASGRRFVWTFKFCESHPCPCQWWERINETNSTWGFIPAANFQKHGLFTCCFHGTDSPKMQSRPL